MERKRETEQRLLKLQENYPSARLIMGPSDLNCYDFPDGCFNKICIQVSEMIDEYNASHPYEMLPKSPETIADQILKKRSVMIICGENENFQVMCHGTIYPSFEEEEAKILGMQVVEIGTLIVHPDYRRRGMGSLGNLLLLELSERYSNCVALATIKQRATALAFKNAGANPASFWKYPYLSYLTCTCSHCSEREGHRRCEHRRLPSESTEIKLNEILDKSFFADKIPCTLIIADIARAQKFEETCRNLHQKWLKVSFQSITPNNINSAFREINFFFEHLANGAAND